jgi:hypothetical protein
VGNKTANSSLIFWYDGKEKAFFYCDVTQKLIEKAGFDCRQEQLSWSPSDGEEIIAMMSFDQERFNSTKTPYECRSGNKQCDYLCVEEEGVASCKCPLFRNRTTEDESKCRDISCPNFHVSCQDDLECFPSTYACDGIEHCANGFDETDFSITDDDGCTIMPCL